jgi:hypothetical protein
MKACTYCGRENEDSATLCREYGTEWETPAIRQPISRGSKIFAAFCIAAPGAAALAYPLFAVSVPVSAVCAIAGVGLSIVLLIWSLVSLLGHWQRALLGFGCLLVALWCLVVMADIFAAYQRRRGSPNHTMQPMGASRLAQSQVESPWRLAPTADGGRSAAARV